MFWKKKDKTTKKIDQYIKGGIEVTRMKTSKPILPAKPGIKIENMETKNVNKK